MVIYFTGTNNSRWCAERLAEALGDECRNSFHFIRDGIAAELISDKPWVFVAPTYAWQLPRAFVDFLRAASFDGAKDAWFVMTCGSEIGNAAASNEALCADLGLTYRGTWQQPMPENYIALFDLPKDAKIRAMVAAARPSLADAAGYISRGEAFPDRKAGLLDKLKSGPVNQGFYKYYIGAKKFLSTDACVSCGKCAELCPLHNIIIEQGRPLWGPNCTHCMACISFCPTRAIEYGSISRGKKRYHGPKEWE